MEIEMETEGTSDQQPSSAQIGSNDDVLNVPKHLLHSLLIGGACDVTENDSTLVVVDLHEGVLNELDRGLMAAIKIVLVFGLIPFESGGFVVEFAGPLVLLPALFR